jgi:hypothetical protein
MGRRGREGEGGPALDLPEGRRREGQALFRSRNKKYVPGAQVVTKKRDSVAERKVRQDLGRRSAVENGVSHDEKTYATMSFFASARTESMGCEKVQTGRAGRRFRAPGSRRIDTLEKTYFFFSTLSDLSLFSPSAFFTSSSRLFTWADLLTHLPPLSTTNRLGSTITPYWVASLLSRPPGV